MIRRAPAERTRVLAKPHALHHSCPWPAYEYRWTTSDLTTRRAASGTRYHAWT